MTVLGFHGGGHCQPGHAETLRAAGALLAFDDMRQLPRLIGRIEATNPCACTSGNLEIPGSMLCIAPGMTAAYSGLKQWISRALAYN
jgi:hypothetical protein